MEWMCARCYGLIHPNRHHRNLTTINKKPCAACGQEAICEMAAGETVQQALELLAEQKEESQ